MEHNVPTIRMAKAAQGLFTNSFKFKQLRKLH